MEYKKFGKTIVLRLDQGDEVLSSLSALCEKEHIRLAKVSGLGAISKATIGLLNTETHNYFSRTYEGMYEIATLTGNITTKEEKAYFHLHITIGNTEAEQCHSGHLNEAVISVTGEIFVDIVDGEVGREFSPAVSLNIFKF